MRDGAFAHDGFVWIPAGSGNDGFVLKAMVTDGVYRYSSGALNYAQVTGRMAGGSVMPGMHFKRGGVSVAVYAGVDMQVHSLSQYDPGNSLQGQFIGARAALDLWAEPTPHSMVTASATITTIGGAYAARIAAGWRVFDRFYLGPEAVAFADPKYGNCDSARMSPDSGPTSATGGSNGMAAPATPLTTTTETVSTDGLAC